MTTLPSLTGKQLVAALERAGFRVIRIKEAIMLSGIPTEDQPR